MYDVTTVSSEVNAGHWPHSHFELFLPRCATGHVAEALRGRPHTKLGDIQQAIWPAGEQSLPRQSVLYQSLPRLVVHHPEERDVGRRQLLHLLLQCLPQRLQTTADLPGSSR